MPSVADFKSDYEIVCSSEDRSGWLEARRTGVGSSDAPAVIGVSPFKSGIAVYTEKLGLAVDEEETEVMKWGRIMEGPILEEFGKETGRTVVRAGKLLRSKRWPWLMSTLDGDQFDPKRDTVGVAEAKGTAFRVGDWDEGIPPHIACQVQTQLAVTGRKWGSVVVLQHGCRLKWADVERDDRFIEEQLIPATQEFWRRVQEQIPVAPDGSPSAAAALKVLYPEPHKKMAIQLPAEVIDLDEELAGLKAQIKADKKRQDWIEQWIKHLIGDAEMGCLSNGVTYTHTKHSRDGYSVGPCEYRQLRRIAPKEF